MNYKCKRWLKTRQHILRRDGYRCQEYKRYGRAVAATIVHHIYPVEEYPELAYEAWNLVSLSAEKHNAMHDRDTHKITALGREYQRRHKREFEDAERRLNGL